jgi:hypothetical protein
MSPSVRLSRQGTGGPAARSGDVDDGSPLPLCGALHQSLRNGLRLPLADVGATMLWGEIPAHRSGQVVMRDSGRGPGAQCGDERLGGS